MSTRITGKWRAGYGPRELFQFGHGYFVFKSNHPLEERIIELTTDYLDEHGDFVPPELVAWDGVETSPGILIAVAE